LGGRGEGSKGKIMWRGWMAFVKGKMLCKRVGRVAVDDVNSCGRYESFMWWRCAVAQLPFVDVMANNNVYFFIGLSYSQSNLSSD
jgi:hypothetical protein